MTKVFVNFQKTSVYSACIVQLSRNTSNMDARQNNVYGWDRRMDSMWKGCQEVKESIRLETGDGITRWKCIIWNRMGLGQTIEITHKNNVMWNEVRWMDLRVSTIRCVTLFLLLCLSVCIFQHGSVSLVQSAWLWLFLSGCVTVVLVVCLVVSLTLLVWLCKSGSQALSFDCSVYVNLPVLLYLLGEPLRSRMPPVPLWKH